LIAELKIGVTMDSASGKFFHATKGLEDVWEKINKVEIRWRTEKSSGQII
jgi:hypothetical protein